MSDINKIICEHWELFFYKYSKYIIPLYFYGDVGNMIHISVEELYQHFRNRYNEEFTNEKEHK